MSMDVNVKALATRVGQEVKQLRGELAPQDDFGDGVTANTDYIASRGLDLITNGTGLLGLDSTRQRNRFVKTNE